MNRLLFLLYTLVEQRFRPKYDARLQFLEAQIHMLRRRLDSSRIVPTPAEKCELLRIGDMLKHDVSGVLHIVQPDTYRAWVRKQRKRIPFRRSGRPRISEALRNLIIRIQEENAPWGYRRIVGGIAQARVSHWGIYGQKDSAGGRVPSPTSPRHQPHCPTVVYVHPCEY